MVIFGVLPIKYNTNYRQGKDGFSQFQLPLLSMWLCHLGKRYINSTTTKVKLSWDYELIRVIARRVVKLVKLPLNMALSSNWTRIAASQAADGAIVPPKSHQIYRRGCWLPVRSHKPHYIGSIPISGTIEDYWAVF